MDNAIAQRAVFLNLGDLHFHCPVPGTLQPTRIHTLLGSCVSVILWHPQRCLAGMCHIVLPSRNRRGEAGSLDGKYADEAIELFRRELIRYGAQPQQFYAYLAGGGRMYLTDAGGASIGDRNIEAARAHLKKAGFQIRAEHVGLDGYRKVEVDLTSGAVSLVFANKRINLSGA